jgi:DNA-nicking Smr family endonuclease
MKKLKPPLLDLDPPRRRERPLTPEEIILWRAAIGEETESPDPAVLETPIPALSEPMPASSSSPLLRVSAPRPVSPIDRGLYQRIREEATRIDARIDLHHHTLESAHRTLHAFILSMRERGKRTLLVITGKGRGPAQGVLRRDLPRWLQEAPFKEHVLSFARAATPHGGEGAWYVRLRRKEK